ncbi:DUF6616 family protein [Streptomyces chartreusis]
MQAFLELWRPRPQWLELPVSEREAYLKILGTGMAELAAAGVEVVGWGSTNPNVDNDSGYNFFAIWRMSSEAEVALFSNIVASSGWYNYFDQVNATGELRAPEEVIAELVQM